ncbi:MAG: histidine phosphotransferase family protein [Boseongicola sp.]|nr:histidine phosphotransferase family protein [Boseongicola sp.]
MNGNDLTALIGSRICHDLISPLGAIGNGVELLSLSGMGATPEMALIAESIENANARIRFFRIAFGAAAQSVQIGAAENASIIRDMFKNARTRVTWDVDGSQERAEVKLAFLMILCLEDTLPRGGEISVSKNGAHWKLDAKGEQLRERSELWSFVNQAHTHAHVAASDVHFALVHDAAQGADRQVATFIGEDMATVSF